MNSVEDLLDALNCLIGFTTPEGEYEGILKQVFVPAQMITVGKILLLPSKIRLGTLNFMFQEVTNVNILIRPEVTTEKHDKNVSVYFRSDIEDMFNLDGDSDEEPDCNIGVVIKEEEFVLKLLPCFSEWISSDSQIIDSLNNEFSLAIKHILREDLIGVSLEGPQISRNGILTWICISTPSCTYLFDILALGDESFQSGLKSILENSKIQKIFHDCRLASDCLFHVYKVCLINVFDTQVADSLVMMQESKSQSIIKQVNSLDTCLSYYLEIPDDYLYKPLSFSLDKKSTDYHGLRPLPYSFRGSMIKNVIYLPLLKRELETALLTPLRRATDVYLNVIQNATDRELMVAPPITEELPPELLLEGIQIVRYQQHEYIPSIISSGPPYRKLLNPIKDYVEYCRKFETGEKIKCLPIKDGAESFKILRTKQENQFLSSEERHSQDSNEKEFYPENFLNEICAKPTHLSKDSLKDKKIINHKETNDVFNVKKLNDIQNSVSFHQTNERDSDCKEESFIDEMTRDISAENTLFNKMPSIFGDLSVKMQQIHDKNCVKIFIDPSEGDNYRGKAHVASNARIQDYKDSSNERALGKIINEVEKNALISENSNVSENGCKVGNPVGNCLLRHFDKKDSVPTTSSVTTEELIKGNSTFLDQELKMNSRPTLNEACDALWNQIRKECATQHSSVDFKSKIRFIPAGMTLF